MEPSNVLGIGQVVMDSYYPVSQEVFDAKNQTGGGQQIVDEIQYDELTAGMKRLEKMIPAGSTTNMAKALCDLGESVRMRVVMGDDEEGAIYLEELKSRGASVYPYIVEGKRTARSAIFVAPNGERDMNTCLGAADAPFDVPVKLFDGKPHVHIEGYLVGVGEVVGSVAAKIRDKGLSSSIDLGSEGFVKFRKNEFQKLMRERVVKVLFGNEDEIMALTGESLERSCKTLSQHFNTVVATRGAKGGFVHTKGDDHPYKFSAKKVDAVCNSTGCGDNFMGGFLYGYIRGRPPKTCAQIGALLGAEIIKQGRPDLPRDRVKEIRRQAEELLDVAAESARYSPNLS
jgi:sugar/nucleoside kinase (ribokinase family)